MFNLFFNYRLTIILTVIDYRENTSDCTSVLAYQYVNKCEVTRQFVNLTQTIKNQVPANANTWLDKHMA